ncbi:MAG: TA system VapC family ribonuclease toxin, partial [Bryobacteraceae bacterium]
RFASRLIGPRSGPRGGTRLSAALLDVNVLIALFWPAHEFHKRVQHWFARNGRRGWATCPFTQAGFIRIVSNPAFSRDAVAPMEAVRVLKACISHPAHSFWPADIGVPEAIEAAAARLATHRQVTDAYLLGLAIRNRGRLVTLDHGVPALLAPDHPNRPVIEVIVPDTQ